MKKIKRVKQIIHQLKILKRQSTPMECDTIQAVLECYLYPLQDEMQDTDVPQLKIEPGKHIIAGQTKRGK